MSATRVSNGQTRVASMAELPAIEARYGVPREILTSIWGMETSYGAILGNTDVPAGLATMAWEGRRRAFAETELLALIRILELGKVVREQLVGSWAGAMGQTQFMPSTFLNHSVDWEGDGRKDLWRSAPDALASAANYLKASGWRAGEPWGVEVTLPEGFDYGLTDGARRSVAGLTAFGVTTANGGPLPLPTGQAELFAPAGSHGPVFALYVNFDVIKRYNNADSYALAVGLLSDAIAGRPGLVKPWPVGMRLLSTIEARDLQQRLTALGYDTKGVDGVIGRNTRAALQRFQSDRGLLADGYPTAEMLAAVRAASA
jgi:membrane-bound lytic murein transglycosylase B